MNDLKHVYMSPFLLSCITVLDRTAEKWAIASQSLPFCLEVEKRLCQARRRVKKIAGRSFLSFHHLISITTMSTPAYPPTTYTSEPPIPQAQMSRESPSIRRSKTEGLARHRLVVKAHDSLLSIAVVVVEESETQAIRGGGCK